MGRVTMKPGDHPDFFRLPPPPGRSRESRIVLDEQGRFWNGPFLIDHAGMATAFATWIRRHPDDGRYILTNGYDWTYLTVKATPYFVRHVEISGDEANRDARLLLSDGSEELLDPAGVTVDEAGVLHASVKEGQFEARFLPTAQSAMVEMVGESADGLPCIVSGTSIHQIRQRQ